MSGFDNEVLYAIGERLEPSTAQAIGLMQKTVNDVSNINHTGNPEGVVSANPSSLSHDPVSGSIYKKNSGTGNTGWGEISSISSKITKFLSSSTWTIDPRSKSVEFYLWGGGGGGGSGHCGASGASSGGSGGAPGQFSYVKTLAAQLTASPYTITIGPGGTGGISINAITTNGNPGNPGNPSSVVGVIIANGGGAGNGGLTGNTPGGIGVNPFFIAAPITTFNESFNGGNGNATTGNAAGDLTYGWSSGGGGGGGYILNTPQTGGRGGNILDQAGSVLVSGGLAGANTGALAGFGNSPTGQPLMLGGTGGGGGGNNGTITAGTGGNGAQPSGGGGGGGGNLNSNASGAGGNGGNGQIIIIEYF